VRGARSCFPLRVLTGQTKQAPSPLTPFSRLREKVAEGRMRVCSAHYQASAAARDAVKKEALRRAGITYHEVVAGQTTPMELRRLVERLLVGEKVGAF